MTLLQPPELDDDFIYLHVWKSDRFAKFKWNALENFPDLLKNNNEESYYNSEGYCSYVFGNEEVFIYEITCCDNKDYYLVSMFKEENFDPAQICGMFVMPRNKFNLIIFFKEFIEPVKSNVYNSYQDEEDE
jgi:hypothetical protein